MKGPVLRWKRRAFCFEDFDRAANGWVRAIADSSFPLTPKLGS